MDTNTVKLSPKYQIVIPKGIREGLKLRPGNRLVMIKKGKIIYLVPVGKIEEAIGIAKGATSEGLREHEDRFD